MRSFAIKTLKRSATEFAVNGVTKMMKVTWRLLVQLNHQTKKKPFQTKMSRYMSSSSFSEFVPPCNSSYVSRNIFSLREKEDLFRLFKPTIKNGIISKPAVKNILQEDEAGRQFLKQFTVDQIVNRLKYERRMNQKRT